MIYILLEETNFDWFKIEVRFLIRSFWIPKIIIQNQSSMYDYSVSSGFFSLVFINKKMLTNWYDIMFNTFEVNVIHIFF